MNLQTFRGQYVGLFLVTRDNHNLRGTSPSFIGSERDGQYFCLSFQKILENHYFMSLVLEIPMVKTLLSFFLKVYWLVANIAGPLDDSCSVG